MKIKTKIIIIIIIVCVRNFFFAIILQKGKVLSFEQENHFALIVRRVGMKEERKEQKKKGVKFIS